MTFITALTHSDWIFRKEGLMMNLDGIKYMLETCRNFGIRRILWRAFDGGCANYPSKLTYPVDLSSAEKLPQWDYFPLPPGGLPDRWKNIDHRRFDSIEKAISIGHSLDMEVYTWVTINEDDHGAGVYSKFTQAHPEYRWRRRNGNKYRSQLSFAYPEVQEYKIQLINEVLERNPDGLFLDWIRTGDIRDNPQANQAGWADFGYEEPNVERFISQYGINPEMLPETDIRWLECRAKPLTDFMRKVRTQTSHNGKKVPVSVMVHNPWGYRGDLTSRNNNKMGGNLVNGSYAGLLCDVKTWAKENLIDAAVAAGYYIHGGNAIQSYNYLAGETENTIPTWMYDWVPKSEAALQACLETANKTGTSEILFWEADYFESIPEEEKKIMSKKMNSWV